MKISKIFLFVGVVVCLANLALCQDDPTTELPTTSVAPTTPSSTTDAPKTTTSIPTTVTTTTTISTTKITTTKETTTTTTKPETTTTTTKPETTTTTPKPETTTTSTTTEPTTTTLPTTTTTAGPEVDKIFNFTVPSNSSEPACLRAKFSLSFDIVYPAESNNTKFNSTLKMNFENYNDYTGICNETFNTLSIRFHDDWTLLLKYVLKNSAFDLETIQMNYTVDSKQFPNVSGDYVGKKSVLATNLNEFSANKGNSYKCSALTTLSLEDTVKLEIKNYQAQPFINQDSKSNDFDTAIECAADTTSTSKLVPIIVGSALAVLVVLVLVAYIIGRRKHRPGYQQV